MAVSHNHDIVVAGSDTGAKQLAAIFLKIAFCGNKYVGVGVKAQKFAAHLFGQVVGDNDQCFIAQPQALFLHCCCAHNHCFTCADGVSY